MGGGRIRIRIRAGEDGRVHLREAVYWGKQEESAIRAALGYGGVDVA
jgi:hypothetical protein